MARNKARPVATKKVSTPSLSTEEENEDYMERTSQEQDVKMEGVQEAIQSETTEGAALTSRGDVSLRPNSCNINKVGRAAEAGIISKVYVENFMCHRKLTVELCQNVNFIHGQNGSGKSAILAAIQICLGAGARRTHRARNLQGLIRRDVGGENIYNAIVQVHIRNKSDDGYQREKYGNTIVVERTISKGSSAGGYKMYRLIENDDGKNKFEKKLVSKSKKDLEDMLDQLNIQVENPVVVLDQEEAKKFLNGKPEDKYTFFTKATELERMDRNYASITDNINDLKQTNENTRKSLDELKNHVQNLAKKIKECEELEQLEERYAELKVMCAWAIYKENAQKLEVEKNIANETKARYEKKSKEYKEALDIFENNENSANTEISLKEKIASLTEEAQNAARSKNETEEDLRQQTLPKRKFEQEISANKREIRDAKKKLEGATSRLDDARRKILEATGNAQSEEAQRTKKISETETAIEEYKERQGPLKHKIQQSKDRYEELEDPLARAKEKSKTIYAKLQDANRRLKEFQRSEGTSLGAFGQKCEPMAKKVLEMKRRSLFKGPVLGPIGAHIKITSGKDHLAKLAEYSIGKATLGSFIVTNNEDRKTFMQLREDLCCRGNDCGIFLSSIHARYQIPTPPQGVDTIASVLTISDDLVFNCLVDNANIESIALCSSFKESEEKLLVKDSSGKEFIRGGEIKRVFFLPNADAWGVQQGTRQLISNFGALKRQTIGVDRSALIEDSKNEVLELNEKSKEARNEEQDVEQKQRSEKKMWNELNRSLSTLTTKINQLQNTLETLKSEAEAAGNFSIDTSELEEDVSNAREVLETLQEKELELNRKIESLIPGIQTIRDRLKEITSRNEKIMSDLSTTETQMGEFYKMRNIEENRLEKRRMKAEKLKASLEQQEEVVVECQNETDKMLNSARQITLAYKRNQSQDAGFADQVEDEDLESIPIQDTDKKPTVYVSKMNNIRARVDERKKRKAMEDPIQVMEKYKRAKKNLDDKMNSIDSIQTNIDKLAKDLNDRKMKWKLFQSHISATTDQIFDDILNKKGSSGKLEFDHVKKTLNPIVQKDNYDDKSQTKDVKSLSGGEKSYATLALLLALGENLETPFRVMDEFDVFLDPVSRKIALETMIQTAKQMEHRQFIFITPQDLSSVTPDEKLKIVKLRNPERKNRASNLTQTTF